MTMKPASDKKKPMSLDAGKAIASPPDAMRPVAIKPSVVPMILSFAATLLAFCNLLLMMFQATALNVRMPAARTSIDLMVSMSLLVVSILISLRLRVPKPPNESAQAQPAAGIRPANRGVYRLLPGALG